MVMRSMRRNFHYLKYFIYAVILVFVGAFALQIGKSVKAANAVAVVNGIPVSEEQYSRAVQARLDQMRAGSSGEVTAAQAAKARREALDSLEQQALLQAASRKLGLSVSDAELAHAIEGSFAGQGGFSQAQYQQFLQAQAQQGVSPAQAEESLRQQVLLRKWRLFLETNVHLSQAEIGQAQERARRKARATLLAALVQPLEAKVELKEDDIKDYYARHRQEWEKKGEVKARHILLKVDPKAGTTAEFEARQKAKELARQARNGADFAALARKNSQDEGSASKGGDLGYFGPGMMVPEFDKAAFALKPGEISDPVRSQFGWHVIKLEAKKPGFDPTWENSRDKAEKALRQSRAAQQARQLALQAAEKLAAGASLQDASKLPGLSLMTTGWFDGKTETLDARLGKTPGLATALLKLDKGGRLDHPQEFEKGYVLAELKDEQKGPARKLEPKELEALSADLRDQKTDDLFEGWIASLKAKAKITENLAMAGE
jgi:peptidyl-prolyl cis-trans isomerase D